MPRRWEREKAIARQYMGDVRAFTSPGLAAIGGNIILPNKYGDGIRDSFRICIIYPSDFLHALTSEGFVNDAPTHPSVYLLSHHDVWERKIDGHIMPDWSLCLYIPGEAEICFREINSLERLLEVTKTFLVLERIYQKRLLRERANGPKALWPGPERSHGYPGLMEAIAERGGLHDDELCICGSGLRFGRCHKDILHRETHKRDAA